ncbi:uncharacterized protein [Macrobrachium rosenbergii]|uniref:uncharacterized protein n=1 Tax=Macrobrachium rosenbergii TaxID=79674 RepID=UPI0034D6292D
MEYNLDTPSPSRLPGIAKPLHETESHSPTPTTPESTKVGELKDEKLTGDFQSSDASTYPRSTCSNCNSAFGSLKSFQDHVVQVSSIAYPCYMCRLGYYRFPIGVYFRDVTNLASSDLSVCRMDQWYVCSVCKARFREETEAIVHIRLHCPFCKRIVVRCNYDFALESQAAAHLLFSSRRKT